jgi:hypothetical protein
VGLYGESNELCGVVRDVRVGGRELLVGQQDDRRMRRALEPVGLGEELVDLVGSQR